MPRFAYQALSASGTRLDGVLEASSRAEAYRQLDDQRLSPLELKEQSGPSSGGPGPLHMSVPRSSRPPHAPAPQGFTKKTPPGATEGSAPGTPVPASSPAASTESAGPDSPRPRLNRSRLIFFTGELADLLDAGLPAQQALTVMAEKQEDPLIRRTSSLARLHLREGRTLSGSFRLASASFDDFYTSLVAAGEASGTLAGVLRRLAVSMTQLQEMQRKFTAAMVYPAFMAGACALLMMVFTMVLVPQLTSLLSKTGQQLPAITRGLLALSGFCTTWFWHLLLSAAGAALLFRLLINSRRGRPWWDRAKLRIPLFGPIIESRFYAEFTQALGNLVTNGVPLLPALKLLVAGTSNRHFRTRLEAVIEAVSSGDPLSISLRRAGGFQPLMTDIIAVGEQTGHLSRSLEKAAGRYEQELNSRIKRLTALISPVIIIFLACIVTVVAYCIVSSIFSAVSGIRSKTG